jgi:hypothetical protein
LRHPYANADWLLRPDVRDVHADPDQHAAPADQHPDADTDADQHRDADPNQYRDGNADEHRDSNADQHRDGDPDQHPDTAVNTNRDRDSDPTLHVWSNELQRHLCQHKHRPHELRGLRPDLLRRQRHSRVYLR